MKKLILPMTMMAMLLLSSCYTETIIGPEGPRGPQGPQGPEGLPGQSGYVFEWENINFTAPNYDVVLAYPNNFETFSSDVALVFLLWDTYETDQGEIVEVWRPVPQTVLTSNGMIMYNYDVSRYDVRLFVDADFSRDLLGAIDTDGWVARVVVVPGEIWNSGRVDISDYHSLVELLGLPDLPAKQTITRR